MIATRPTDTRPYVQRARRWSRENLFSSNGNTALTVVTVVVLVTLVLSLGRFVFISADWTVIETNRRLLFLGRTPLGEEWRFWPPIWALLGSGWFAFGLWLRVDAKGYAIIASVLAFMFLPHPLQLVEDENALLLLVGVALGAVGYTAARSLPVGSAYRGQAQVGAVIALALLLPLMIVMLRIDGGVRTTLWSGLMLNVMLAAIGIAFGFPMGVLLALARASSYPVIRWTATGYIELVRAAPLVAWLFIARFVLPDFLPPVAGLDDLDIVIRAMLVLAGFAGAYIAEIVRGGLQSVDRGQARGLAGAGLERLLHDRLDCAAAGATGGNPGTRQPVHLALEGHDAGLRAGADGAAGRRRSDALAARVHRPREGGARVRGAAVLGGLLRDVAPQRADRARPRRRRALASTG